MQRRKFLLNSTIILSGIGLGSFTSCKNAGVKPNSEVLNLEEITIAQLQKGYAEGQFTIVDVVKGYLKRIEEIDKAGPALNSILVVNPDALKIAEQLDKERQAGKSRGPLHGIPVVLKDNIDTIEMPNTAGSRALTGSIPPHDSTVARKLREAGAIILAKANLSEWANFRSNLSSSGWSGLGGQVKNPYVLDRNPCGSSSGSGAAVAASLCAIAIGTETNGSIVCPSNNCGIVGIKPTVGLVSRAGIIPISFSQDTAGPMCRTVRDAAITLGALTGVDERDSKTPDSEGHSQTDYTQFLKADGLKGKRIGFDKSFNGSHPRVDKLMEAAVAFLKNAGAEVVDLEQVMQPGAEGSSFNVMLFEFKDGLNKYFASLGEKAPVKSVEDLIAFNEKDSVEMQFDQELLKKAQAKGDLQSKEYQESLAKMLKATRELGIDKVMNEHRLDAIVAPTGAPAWKTDLVNGDHYMFGSSSAAAISGYPNINVPMGFVEELPVGISFYGRAWSEPVLLEIAYAYEQGTLHRQAPKYLPTD
jgi:amidase